MQQGVSGFNLSFKKLKGSQVTTGAWKKNGNVLQINPLGSHRLRKIGCYLDFLCRSINIILMVLINNEESKLCYSLWIQNYCAFIWKSKIYFKYIKLLCF